MTYLTVDVLKGKTLSKVTIREDAARINFETVDGEEYVMYHSQNCCENVSIEDICGDISDLIGSPLVEAEEVSNEEINFDIPEDHHCYSQESHTWTFYKFRTAKGSVVLRWLGTSNGYYSENVDFDKI